MEIEDSSVENALFPGAEDGGGGHVVRLRVDSAITLEQQEHVLVRAEYRIGSVLHGTEGWRPTV